MASSAYTYEPGNIKEFGKDRMRFELGDTMVEGGSDTTALTDQEIQAAIGAYPASWKRWRKDYETLEKEVKAESRGVPKFANGARNKPPYFYTGMQRNERAGNR